MFYIDIIDNSLSYSIFICPFEIDIAFEGGFKYLRFKHKISRWMDGLLAILRPFQQYFRHIMTMRG